MNVKQELADAAQRVAPGVGAGTVGWIGLNTQLISTWLTITVLVLTVIGYIVKIVMDFKKDARSEKALELLRLRHAMQTSSTPLAELEDFDKRQDEDE